MECVRNEPILVKFVTRVAARFGLVVTEKEGPCAHGSLPWNYAFIEHFQDMARCHFTVRRLKRAYGKILLALSTAGLLASIS
jgi:hypothetical protein